MTLQVSGSKIYLGMPEARPRSDPVLSMVTVSKANGVTKERLRVEPGLRLTN